MVCYFSKDNQVRNIRVWRGLIRREVLEKLTCGVNTLQNIELEKTLRVKANVAEALAEILEFPVEKLFPNGGF